VYTPVDEVVAVVDALMWNSSRNEGELGSSAAGGGTVEIFSSIGGASSLLLTGGSAGPDEKVFPWTMT
jgi:hypothetical protein